ncbi:MAG: serine hydroxymethyltransferase [Anaerolineales bacterium]|nr:serine hydroxymethyltransferase [Anaerolineales bacterium]
MSDFLFRGSLSELDPSVYDLTQLEAERQVRKLILIPSESQAPLAVREALASAFQNIYAEGYPDEETRFMVEADILDYKARLGHFRRFADPRYYKGVEYADIVEALARRRCAEAFAANGVPPEAIFVNVQALSGGPANNAVYHALMNPGDTFMGMNLLHGGHLSHGSSVNRSGKYYNAVHYTIDPQTEQINYDQVEELALQHKPKFIIAGYSSYPWAVDWKRFREIAKSVGAYLFADIAHVAGLVAGGVYPSPVGYADVITFTTHKSLCGPRGACILTTDAALARKIDRAVFPGEQGGPHVNVFAAIALTFKLAQTDQFRQLQSQIIKNCAVFTDRLREHGFRIPYGGTNTHLMNLDCGTVHGPDGTTLSGDQAARILDIAGIVVNRNTIPGDKSALDPSGVRMGTPWVTQRGLKEKEMVALADIISDLLKATTPYSLEGRKSALRRAKVDFTVLEDARLRVRELADLAGADFEPSKHGYPHFYYLDEKPAGKRASYQISGQRVRSFLNYALSSDVESLLPGKSQATHLFTPQGEVDGALTCVDPYTFTLTVESERAGLVSTWLRDLADGYVAFDEDPLRKLPGPVYVSSLKVASRVAPKGNSTAACKPYFLFSPKQKGKPLPAFTFQAAEVGLRRTPVYEVHKKLGAKLIPFAGWEMPVWYSSVLEEHLAVRQAAGLFDVAHMGVYQVEGPDAEVFLDSVVGNDIGLLGIGESCYSHLLTPDAEVIDDLLVYRRGAEKFLVVVNASNDDKDWAWLNAVKDGLVRVSNERPCTRAFGRNAVLRNLRDPKEGADMRVDIALQGPRARDILLAMGVDADTRKRILALKRTELCDAVVGGFDLIVSRTGYTGEKMAFELFVHPERAADLFTALLKSGEPFGIKPIGLGARDSLRTEAGLPLYGQEMGLGSGMRGHVDLGVAEGGFGSYVKTYKPWFIGREAYLEREKSRPGEVVRFRFTEKGVRMAHHGDPVVDHRGRVIGWVTSCAVDSEGMLTGQAYLVDASGFPEGNPISIYQSAAQKAGKAPAEFQVGDKAVVPTPAVVISRFPK